MKTLHLLVAHGSRFAGAQRECEVLLGHYQALLAVDESATLAYLEFATPLLESALAAAACRASRIVVIPIMLFAAAHYKNDLPLVLHRARLLAPGVDMILADELGLDAQLIGQSQAKVRQILAEHELDPASCGLVMVGRGSSDPNANGDFYKYGRLVAEPLGFSSTHLAFAGITQPRLPEILESAARTRPKGLIVLPHLLFGGRLLQTMAEQVADLARRQPWLRLAIAAPLGANSTLAHCLYQRGQHALRNTTTSACDTCHYRVPIAGVATQVGGYQALLWSIRHREVHGQLGALGHSHVQIKKHVLVCSNTTCAGQDSLRVAHALQHAVRECGASQRFKVTQTSCLGRCGQGPVVAVYPDGVWYRAVTPEDSRELVREHLQGDRIVARLVDTILMA